MHPFEIIEERFGIPPGVFEGFTLVRYGRKHEVLVPESLLRETDLDIESAGIPFVRINVPEPKLTTAAAMCFGHHATRNYVQLEYPEAQAYVSRKGITLRPEQAATCTSDGYVLVQHNGITLGVGFLHVEDLVLNSLYPKSWSVRPGVGAQPAP